MIPIFIYIIISIISIFFILSSIMRFFEVTPDVYLIYVGFSVFISIMYIILPRKGGTIFSKKN
jgi:hypothetical protein